ncbi:MAG: DNA mismatch repair protein MutS [Dysgonamonadaceae bacterium]|jgi:hypothetical protein|nr:DNA mismatch repair protein MutS [Dysgonamonadaceae bacterium]
MSKVEQENIRQYYLARLEKTQRSIKNIQRRLYYIGTARLLVVIVTIVFAYFFYSYMKFLAAGIFFAGVAVFLVLLKKFDRLQKNRRYMETSAACDKNELKSLDYDFSAFDGAPEKIDAGHFFSLDLDIFGQNSLFQSINRTCTGYGKKILVDWFEKPLQSISPIQNRQKAVEELTGKDFFLHHFRVLALTDPGKDSDYAEIENFAASRDFISHRKIWKVASVFFPCLWIALIIYAVFGFLSYNLLIVTYILTLFISESLVKKINLLQIHIGKKVNILYSYSSLIEAIENEEFQSPVLSELKSHFFRGSIKASFLFKKLAQLTDELEQRANLFTHILLNPLLLWDIRKAIKIEEWKDKNGKELIEWIKILGEMDAFCSLGIFRFNHPDYVFPSFTDTYFTLKGEETGHPLMNGDTFVRNDVDIEKCPFFLIITGANMAGKSTYLRTVGVNHVLACIGAPVCAKSMLLYPARLITSLRTSDSLINNESYFFAELKRLKIIIDQLKAGEKMFIILDEILKGTNSIDKQKGSLALIQQLVRLQTCGIIASHDLLLGSLEKDFPSNVKNQRFEAEIKDDELFFSYKIQDGIAQNMNATFLMQKMGITVKQV